MLEPNTAIIHELWRRLKLVEKKLDHWKQPAAVINVPALIQLRYSLVNLLRYLCGEPDALQNLQSSLIYAKRAHYYCLEAEALFYFKEFVLFQETFKKINLLEYIPEFINWSSCFSAARECMQEVSNDDRDEYCESLEAKLVELRPIHEKLTVVRVELLKYVKVLEDEAERAREQERRATNQLEIQRKHFHVAVGALIIALIGAAVTISTVLSKNSTTITPGSSHIPTQPNK